MKKIVMIVISLMLMVGLCSTNVALAKQEILFQNELTGGIPSQMTAYWGNWSSNSNGLSVTTDANEKDFPKIITSDSLSAEWTDYIIEVDIINLSEGGIIFRSKNASEGPDGFAGYYVGYDSAYAFFGKDVNGWQTVVEDGQDAPAAKALGYTATMHWKLVAEGSKFTLYVDDMQNPFIQVSDSTYPSGGVGLRTHIFAGDESGCFKNLKIYKMETESNEPKDNNEVDKNNSTAEKKGCKSIINLKSIYGVIIIGISTCFVVKKRKKV